MSFPRKHLKQITNLMLHLPNKREKERRGGGEIWHINTCNTAQWHQQINEVIHTMRPLIRVVWQAITPGIMLTVISGRPSTRETWQQPFPFFVFSSDELLKNFISCIWRFSLIPCQRNNLLAAPVKGEGEEHRLSVCFETPPPHHLTLSPPFFCIRTCR